MTRFPAHVGAMERPEHLNPPPYLSKSPPVPGPKDIVPPAAPEGEGEHRDPTRYGDWEKRGIAIDF